MNARRHSQSSRPVTRKSAVRRASTGARPASQPAPKAKRSGPKSPGAKPENPAAAAKEKTPAAAAAKKQPPKKKEPATASKHEKSGPAARPRPAPKSPPSASKPTAPAPATASAPPPSPSPAPAPAPAPRPVPRRPLVTLTVVTRKSPLALAQAELALARLTERIPEYAFKLLKLVTTGDRQEEWSLQQHGGTGLFTGEIEASLRDMRADIAVHSAKDLPSEMTPGLSIAGYLPREDPRDMLILREGLARPGSIATGSPRRRMQLQRQFTKATFVEIRGNVETRLRKIAEDRIADATVLAVAGLKRLGIEGWPGLRFQLLPLAVCVPAVGQAAIALQARGETALALRPHLDEVTRRAVELERCFLRALGGGCHTAFAVHYDGHAVHVFHESCGYQRFGVVPAEAGEPERVTERLLTLLKLENV